MSSAAVETRLIASDETLVLRQRILRPGVGVEGCVFAGDDDTETVHFGAYVGDELVGIASLYTEASPDFEGKRGWRIRGMATDVPVQGKGFGAQMVLACLAHAQSEGGEVLWCNARTSAIGFYAKLGFEVVGEEFEIPEVGPHVVMGVVV